MAVYQIQIAGPNNESVVFSPTREKLRGRWDYSKVAHRDKSTGQKALAAAAPIIPGLVVVLDTSKSLGMILDPLSETADGKQVFAAIQAVMTKYDMEFGGERVQPWPTQEHKLSLDGVKTWAHFMRQLLDTGYAIHAGGAQLPPAEEIAKWPGRRERDPLNSGPQSKELAKYVDEVPADGATAKAGK